MRLAWKSDLRPGIDPLYLGCRSIASDGTPDQERIARGQNRHQRQSGRAPESVNHELIFLQISPLGDPATQSMTSSSHENAGAHRCRIRMTSPATRCFGSASCPCSSWVPACWGKRRVADTGVTTNPSRISIVAERVLSARRAKLSVERNVQQYVQHEN